MVWGHWEWLTKRKLPGLLVFPKVELMLMFSMLTGASQVRRRCLTVSCSEATVRLWQHGTLNPNPGLSKTACCMSM